MFSDLINVACAHGDHQIVVVTFFQKKVFNGIKGWEIIAFGSFVTDIICQIFTVDSKGIGLTGCIYICKYHHICQCKGI